MRESGFDNIYNLNPKRIRNRRIKVFGLMFLSTLLATAKWVTVIPTDSTVFTKILMVSLFILTFAWIALFFWSSVFGFFELLAKRKVPGIVWVPESTPLKSRTAILMPVYNESPQSVFANLLAMANDLKKPGKPGHLTFSCSVTRPIPKSGLKRKKPGWKPRNICRTKLNFIIADGLKIPRAKAAILRISAINGERHTLQ